MARRRSVAQALAEALRLRQEAKLAEARRAQQAQQRAAARPGLAKRPPSPAAEQARLAQQGEKLLKRQEAEKAREVARIEADWAEREAQRKRDADTRERERLRAEKGFWCTFRELSTLSDDCRQVGRGQVARK